MHPVCPPATMYYSLFFHCHTQKMDYLGTGCFLCPGTKEYIHVYKIPAIFFTTKRMNGKIVPIRFFFLLPNLLLFPKCDACVSFFFLSFLFGKRGGGGTSPQFNAGRVITDSVASADMIAIGGVWNRWRSLPRKNAAIFFPNGFSLFFAGNHAPSFAAQKGGISPLQHKREKRTFFQFCSTSRRGQPRRTKKGQIGAPR